MGLNKAIEALKAERKREKQHDWPEDEIGQALPLWGFEAMRMNTYRMATPRMLYTIARLKTGGYKMVAKSPDKSLRILITGINERRQLEKLLEI